MNAPADRCRGCSAEMATDQRYCVECGTRRGKPRFTLASSSTTSGTTSPSVAPASALATGWTRLTALLAVIIVLLALGIGVLIGNSGSQPVKVQLSGGALTGGTSGSASASKSGAGATKKTTTKPPANAFSSGS